MIIAALAVYKIVHVITSLLPRDVMPWVKVIGSTIISFVVAALLKMDDYVVSSLAIATLSGVVHAIIRMMMYTGDLVARRATR